MEHTAGKIGIICEILSIFLITTELYGHENLVSINSAVAKSFSKVRAILQYNKIFLTVCALAFLLCIFTAWRLVEENPPTRGRPGLGIGGAVFFIIYFAISFPAFHWMGHFGVWDYIVFGTIGMVLIYIPLIRGLIAFSTWFLGSHPHGLFVGLGLILFLIGKLLALGELSSG